MLREGSEVTREHCSRNIVMDGTVVPVIVPLYGGEVKMSDSKVRVGRGTSGWVCVEEVDHKVEVTCQRGFWTILLKWSRS